MNDLQSTFLILSALLLSYFFCLHLLLFPFWDKFENCCFLAWGFMVLLCLFMTKKNNVKWFFISLSNRKNLQDWESHLRATWINRLEDIACAWSSSLSFDHRSGQDSHGDFFPDTMICHCCTQLHGIKSWIPGNQFRIIVLGTRH